MMNSIVCVLLWPVTNVPPAGRKALAVIWITPALPNASACTGHRPKPLLPTGRRAITSAALTRLSNNSITRALLVVHKGQIVAEAYAPGYTERSLFLGWSMAKSITGLMIGQLEMQGKLEVTETGLFPQWQDDRRNISIEQLLHMTDGLAYDEIYDPGATAPAMLFQHPSA